MVVGPSAKRDESEKGLWFDSTIFRQTKIIMRFDDEVC